MTYRECFQKAAAALSDGGCDSSEYDIYCLMEKYFGIKRLDYLANRQDNAEEKAAEAFLSAISRRAEGYPLQYLLQSWTFMDCELSVGEGVLIPRDDTEVCVRACMDALDRLSLNAPVMIDLCSGSGAIAIEMAKKYSTADVWAVELSERAFPYLVRNKERNHVPNLKLLQKDIFECHRDFADGYFDVILSNPPYIRSDVIPSLQKEVQHEPLMALDGGEDGLLFYRCIAEKWLPKLKKGGILSLEIGEDQAAAVVGLLRSRCPSEIQVFKDIQELDRAILMKY